jgi:hypothetical protein
MSNDATKKKPWAGPKIVDIGSVDAQTTAGTGNLGDQATAEHHWRAMSIDTPEDAKAILPEGE